MINTRFEAYKLRREIRRSGADFVFKRPAGVNDFGEPTGGLTEVATIRGIYHETNSYVTQTVGDAATTRTKKQPMILCLMDDFDGSGIVEGDVVEMPLRASESRSKTFSFVACVDVQEWGIVADLSLRGVEDDGSADV